MAKPALQECRLDPAPFGTANRNSYLHLSFLLTSLHDMYNYYYTDNKTTTKLLIHYYINHRTSTKEQPNYCSQYSYSETPDSNFYLKLIPSLFSGVVNFACMYTIHVTQKVNINIHLNTEVFRTEIPLYQSLSSKILSLSMTSRTHQHPYFTLNIFKIDSLPSIRGSEPTNYVYAQVPMAKLLPAGMSYTFPINFVGQLFKH